MKALSDQQIQFYRENGFLKYDRQVLSDSQLAALKSRSEQIAEGGTRVPDRYIQYEAAFRSETGAFHSGPLTAVGKPSGTSRLDAVRKMTQLCYFDPIFQAAAKAAPIVDVIEDLLGCPDIKLYTDQLMMKPRFNGTTTDCAPR